MHHLFSSPKDCWHCCPPAAASRLPGQGGGSARCVVQGWSQHRRSALVPGTIPRHAKSQVPRRPARHARAVELPRGGSARYRAGLGAACMVGSGHTHARDCEGCERKAGKKATAAIQCGEGWELQGCRPVLLQAQSQSMPCDSPTRPPGFHSGPSHSCWLAAFTKPNLRGVRGWRWWPCCEASMSMSSGRPCGHAAIAFSQQAQLTQSPAQEGVLVADQNPFFLGHVFVLD